jgi:ankyrin repeat protein
MASTNSDINDVLEAIQAHNIDQIRELIVKGVDVNEYLGIHGDGETTFLASAIELGMVDVVAALLELGADPNQLCDDNHQTPLTLAIESDNIEIIQLLLQFKADLEYGASVSGYPLQVACSKGNIIIVRTLLEAGAKANLGDPSLFLSSSQYGKENNEDFDPNRILIEYTPLMLAANNGHFEVVQILVEAGANVNLMDDCSITALTYAARNGHGQIFDHLFPLVDDPEERRYAQELLEKSKPVDR